LFFSGAQRSGVFATMMAVFLEQKPYWASGLCKSSLLSTRPEEQNVGPKATAIMSGVFMVFV
jgi:hypothetical protein